MSKASWRKSDLPGSTAQTEEEIVQDRDGQWGKTDNYINDLRFYVKNNRNSLVLTREWWAHSLHY